MYLIPCCALNMINGSSPEWKHNLKSMRALTQEASCQERCIACFSSDAVVLEIFPMLQACARWEMHWGLFDRLRINRQAHQQVTSKYDSNTHL